MKPSLPRLPKSVGPVNDERSKPDDGRRAAPMGMARTGPSRGRPESHRVIVRRRGRVRPLLPAPRPRGHSDRRTAAWGQIGWHPWATSVAILVLMMCGCKNAETRPPKGSEEFAEKWLGDIRLSKRAQYMRETPRMCVEMYRKMEARCRELPIAVCAGAAAELLMATQRGVWSEVPVAVLAEAVLPEGKAPRRKGTLVTDVCDLTRRLDAEFLAIELCHDRAKWLEIRLEGMPPDAPPTFSTGFAHRVRTVPTEELLEEAMGPDEDGVMRIVITRTSERDGYLTIPDPSCGQLVFWVINKAGRRSNPIPVRLVDDPTRHATSAPATGRTATAATRVQVLSEPLRLR